MMVAMVRKWARNSVVRVVILIGLIGLPIGWAYFRNNHAPPVSVAMEKGDIQSLVSHLDSRGLSLRLVHTDRNGKAPLYNAFLTSTPRTWEELNRLFKFPEHAHHHSNWRGVVYCERLSRGFTRDLAAWEDCGMQIGPFLFFGDPELLDRIHRNLLSQEGTESYPLG
jgi:hypothetical protein